MQKINLRTIWDHKFCLPGKCDKNTTREYWNNVVKEILKSTKGSKIQDIEDAANRLKKRLNEFMVKNSTKRHQSSNELVKQIMEDLTI